MSKGAVTGEVWIGGVLHQLTHWSGDLSSAADRADLAKDIRRAIRGAARDVLMDYHKRGKANNIGEEVSRLATDAVIEQLWKGYCL